MIKRILLVLTLIFLICQSALASQYISNNRTTYIGETELYYCYIYDTDVNLTIRFTNFPHSGNWSAVILMEPKNEERRQKFIKRLTDAVASGSLDTILLPVGDNRLWAYAVHFYYNKNENIISLKDNFYLNAYGQIIGLTKTDLEMCHESDSPETWAIKNLADKYIHARYQEEYARQNTVIR